MDGTLCRLRTMKEAMAGTSSPKTPTQIAHAAAVRRGRQRTVTEGETLKSLGGYGWTAFRTHCQLGRFIGLPRSTAVVAGPNSVPVRTLLLPNNNPFAPLADLEQPDVEGKCNSFSTSAVRIIPTAKQGQKRAWGGRRTKHSVAVRGARPNYAGVRTKADASGVTDAEYNSYKRKKRTGAATEESSSGRPEYIHTVVMKPSQPCRIMDDNFIGIDEAIARHITSWKPADAKRSRPNIGLRYLCRSNQIAVDAADDETRDALLTLKKLPINEKPSAFQAYEAIHKGQICGIIRNAGGMTSEQLMENLHCRKCDIVSTRPLGNKGTTVVPVQSKSLPGPAAGGEHQGVNLEPNKGKAQPSDSPQQPNFEAILEARMAQLEAKIITQVKTMLERTIETFQPETHGVELCDIQPEGQKGDGRRQPLWSVPAESSTRVHQYRTNKQTSRYHARSHLAVRTGSNKSVKGAQTKRECCITHWDRYRDMLNTLPMTANVSDLTQAMTEAKGKATKTLSVPEDHPDLDRHLLSLWNHKLRLLGAYRKRG
ncbi:hypothetical protein HPB48_001438 [Haemaphysalis longicornis]|uniref:Uncharacterized protein n=1 Tax=Haemaphysalis longicornis TaxID=44386 RepID=A0A9J6FGL1_HAELO|nr:hypothetical protein HPB48_001438 [Haemaphysalis longicornis]